MRTCSKDAGPARPHARGYGRATTDRRTPVWDDQGVDGRHPLPDPDPRQGPNRDEPSRPRLQPQANDHDLRGGAADGGDQSLIASLKLLAPAGLSASALAPGKRSASTHTSDAFSHGLGQIPLSDREGLPTALGSIA